MESFMRDRTWLQRQASTSVILLALLIFAPIVEGSHSASSSENLETMAAKLPSGGLYATSAVWDGSKYAYIFGGTNGLGTTGYSDAVLRYEPETDSLRTMNARLPTGRSGTSAAWVGEFAYVFGGSWSEMETSETHGHLVQVLSDQILRYDPRSDTIQLMEARLPTPRWATSAASDGTAVFLFGGYDGSYAERVLKYDPSSDRIASMNGKSGGMMVGATWFDQSAYVWGGGYPGRYDPATDKLTILGSGRCYDCQARDGRTSIVEANGNLYLFGGDRSSSPTAQILRFNLQTAGLTVLNTTLPPSSPNQSFSPGRMATSAVWTGKYAFIFGGEERDDQKGTASWEILRFHPGPGDPPRSTTQGPSGTESRAPKDSPRTLPTSSQAIWLGAIALLVLKRK